MTIERVVIDTSVLLENLISSTGTAARCVRAVFDQEIDLIFSVETFAELSSVVMRPKFERYVGTETRKSFVDLFLRDRFVQILNEPMGCRDPNDDKFLETAVKGRADVLVTRDRDLLDIMEFKGIPICLPQDAMKLIENDLNRNS